MQIRGTVERVLAAVGVQAKACADSHLCCGSAGTYSILQPGIAKELRDGKLANLDKLGTARIVTANIGCQVHLQSGTQVPVTGSKSWISACRSKR